MNKRGSIERNLPEFHYHTPHKRLSICNPSAMSVSPYANTRLLKKVWVSGSTSNAYLLFQIHFMGSYLERLNFEYNCTCIVAGWVWLIPKNTLRTPVSALSRVRNWNISQTSEIYLRLNEYIHVGCLAILSKCDIIAFVEICVHDELWDRGGKLGWAWEVLGGNGSRIHNWSINISL